MGGPAIASTSAGRGGAAGEALPGFAEAYRRFGRALYATALRMLGRPEDAEDVVQETFLKLYRFRPEIDAGKLLPWLRRVAVNDCLDRLRRGKRYPEDELAAEPPAANDGPAAGYGLDLRRAIDALPERARQVFLLHDVEGFKHHEVAGLLGISDGSSKSQLWRARSLLRTRFEPPPRGGRRHDL